MKGMYNHKMGKKGKGYKSYNTMKQANASGAPSTATKQKPGPSGNYGGPGHY